MEDDTLFALEYMYKTYRKNQSDIDSFRETHAKINKQINELVATSTHHDTITGTSPYHVIMNETATL